MWEVPVRDDSTTRMIPLTRGKVALVDAEDFDVLSERSWCLGAGGRYPVSRVGGKVVCMHRLLMTPEQGLEVDHISGDTFDNRRANLRLCTIQENHFNRRRYSNGSSGYKGVSWYRPYSKWRAYATKAGRTHHLGYFDAAEDAAHAYDAAACNLFGEFAYLNFPEAKVTR
jgi:hypothetical protein